jgi:hypothetical protein
MSNATSPVGDDIPFASLQQALEIAEQNREEYILLLCLFFFLEK